MKQRLYCAVMLCVAFLSGCASPAREPLPRVVRIEVPVIIPCPVTVPMPYPYATASLTKESTDFDKIKALLVELKQRDVTEEELRALLAVCAVN